MSVWRNAYCAISRTFDELLVSSPSSRPVVSIWSHLKDPALAAAGIQLNRLPIPMYAFGMPRASDWTRSETTMNATTILLVNDETAGNAARAMRATLAILGHYSVIEANSIGKALALLRREKPDLALLDINASRMSRLQTCTSIREASGLPIIILSSSSEERDKVEALDAGADEYVIKPCGTQELLARIRAGIRRSPSSESAPEPFVSRGLEIDFARRRATIAGKCVHLSPREHDVLRFLVSHADQPVPHRKLLTAVWGSDYQDERANLRMTIRQLRIKIEPEPSKPKYLLTEPWVGYWFASAS